MNCNSVNSRAGRRVGRSIASLALCAAALFARPAGADPGFQLSASVGLGQFTAGAGPPRFAVVPTGSFLLLRGARWLLRCDDAVTLLGATGGQFGVANATTFSFGARWEAVNVSAGLSLAEYSLALCGALRCATVRGLAPGAAHETSQEARGWMGRPVHVQERRPHACVLLLLFQQ